MPRKETLILIADAAGAHFYKTQDRGASITPARESISAPANPKSHEQMSDRLGRTHASVGPARSAIAPKSDPHRAAEEAFAKALARQLDTIMQEGPYQDVLLFAPPAFLGALRKDLPRALAQRIAGEFPKDLMKSPQDEIRSHVRNALFPD
jgi:protein required for attachment to host cells